MEEYYEVAMENENSDATFENSTQQPIESTITTEGSCPTPESLKLARNQAKLTSLNCKLIRTQDKITALIRARLKVYKYLEDLTCAINKHKRNSQNLQIAIFEIRGKVEVLKPKIPRPVREQFDGPTIKPPRQLTQEQVAKAIGKMPLEDQLKLLEELGKTIIVRKNDGD